MARNTSTLRDILFDEIEEVRKGGDPRRAMAVAKLAQQVISTAKVEMEFHRLQAKAEETGKQLVMGSMDLGQRALPVADQSSIENVNEDKGVSKTSKE